MDDEYTAVDDETVANAEIEDMDFEKIMVALRKHAVSLGISDGELLRRLEEQQEESRKEEETFAPNVEHTLEEAAQKKETKTLARAVNSDIRRSVPNVEFIMEEADFDARRKRSFSRKIFEKMKVVSSRRALV